MRVIVFLLLLVTSGCAARVTSDTDSYALTEPVPSAWGGLGYVEGEDYHVIKTAGRVVLTAVVVPFLFLGAVIDSAANAEGTSSSGTNYSSGTSTTTVVVPGKNNNRTYKTRWTSRSR